MSCEHCAEAYEQGLREAAAETQELRTLNADLLAATDCTPVEDARGWAAYDAQCEITDQQVARAEAAERKRDNYAVLWRAAEDEQNAAIARADELEAEVQELRADTFRQPAVAAALNFYKRNRPMPRGLTDEDRKRIREMSAFYRKHPEVRAVVDAARAYIGDPDEWHGVDHDEGDPYSPELRAVIDAVRALDGAE